MVKVRGIFRSFFKCTPCSLREANQWTPLQDDSSNQDTLEENQVTHDCQRIVLENSGAEGDTHGTIRSKRFRKLKNAIKTKNVQLLTHLLDSAEADPKNWNLRGTPLILASSFGFLEGVKLLLEQRGADINARSRNGLTCLLAAAKYQHHAVLLYLLSVSSCPLNEAQDDGYTTLHYLSLSDDALLTSKLLSRGVKINVLNLHGETPLVLAAKHNCLRSLETLLAFGANPNVHLKHSNCAFWIAMDQGNNEVVRMLLEHGADLTILARNGSTAVDVAIMRADFSLMTLLLDHGFDTEQTCARGKTPLITACNQMYLDGIRLLIESGADINTKTPDEETPIFLAVKHNCIEAVRMLLESGADTTISTKNGCSPFWIAMNQENIEAVRLLLMYGAEGTIPRQDGTSAMEVAIKKSDLSLMKIFLDGGFGIEQTSSKEWTPLIAACYLKFLDGIRLLIDRGANVNAQNRIGGTPVFICTRINYMEALVVLLEAGANPNIACMSGDCALHEAVRQGNNDFVDILLKHKADKTKTGKDDMRPIDLALSKTPIREDIVYALLNKHMVVEKHSLILNKSTVIQAAQNVDEKDVRVESAERKLQSLQAEVDHCICCPITMDVMKDPVIAADGYTYERKTIEQWLRQKKESPVTRQPMFSSALIPNMAIKHLIHKTASLSQGD